MTITPVQISPEITDKCAKFATATLETHKEYYTECRGQSEPWETIYWGKLGEYGAALILQRDEGYDWCEPDLGVYPPGQKTHSIDLPYENIVFPVTVKTAARQWRIDGKLQWSWLFNKNDHEFIDSPKSGLSAALITLHEDEGNSDIWTAKMFWFGLACKLLAIRCEPLMEWKRDHAWAINELDVLALK
jgi:hypothetical protein